MKLMFTKGKKDNINNSDDINKNNKNNNDNRNGKISDEIDNKKRNTVK